MRSSHPFVRATLVASFAACAGGAAGTVFAQGLPAAPRDPSSRAFAAAREEAKLLAEKAQRAGAIDHEPPVLHSIKVTGKVDAQLVNQDVSAVVKITDDLSGVVKYAIDFRSPSGMQHVVRVNESPVPATSFTRTIAIGSLPYSDPPFTSFTEPGTWQADLFYAYDANGNFVSYSQSELQRLGPTTFQVQNDRYDIVPPALASGLITTPDVRLSKPPKGTPPGTLPYVGAEISITDSGNGAVSGTYSGALTFCTASCAHSFVMSGLTNRPGLVANTLTVGTQLGNGQQPGSYQIFGLYLVDVAGNAITYTSSAFGGETDFTQFFPQGVIVFVNQ